MQDLNDQPAMMDTSVESLSVESPLVNANTTQMMDFFRQPDLMTVTSTTPRYESSLGVLTTVASISSSVSSTTPLASLNNTTNWDDHSTTLTITASIAVVIAVLGLLGNMLTIIALTLQSNVATKMRRNASTLFIVSLSFADLLFCGVNMPFSASRFFHREWIHGEFLCRLFPFLRYVNVGLSLLSITAITVNRYILIAHRRIYDRVYTHTSIYLMIGFTWLFPFAVLFPTWLNAWGRFGYDSSILNCSILEVDGKSPKNFLFLTAFLVPCLTIIICYARIFWVVHKSKMQVSGHATTSSQQKERETKRKMEEWRVTKMVLIIFCSFLVCYLPITLVKVSDRRVKYPALHLMAYTLVYMSACINPIIYGITNKQYRKAYRVTIRIICNRISKVVQGVSECVGKHCCQISNVEAETPKEEQIAGQTQSRNTVSVSIQCPSSENLERQGSDNSDDDSD